MPRHEDLIRYDIALLDIVVSERSDKDVLLWETSYNILVMFDKETGHAQSIDYHDLMDDSLISSYYFDEAPESGTYSSIFDVIKGIADSLAYDKEHITFRKFGIVYMRPRCDYYIHKDDPIKFEDICRNVDYDEEDYNDGLGR